MLGLGGGGGSYQIGGVSFAGGGSTPLHAMEYLCKSMVCNRKEQTNFYKLDCLIGKCENNCQVTDIKNDLEAKVKLESNINCYVFDNDETNHYDKKGQPKKYSTTARVDEKDTLENIVLHLQSVATKYLILRFFFWLMTRFTGLNFFREQNTTLCG